MNQLHRVRNRIIPSKSFLSVGRQTGFWLVRSWFLSEYYGTFSRASSSRSYLISSWLDIQISCSAVNIINFVQAKTIWSNKSKLSQLNHKSKRNKILDFSKLSKKWPSAECPYTSGFTFEMNHICLMVPVIFIEDTWFRWVALEWSCLFRFAVHAGTWLVNPAQES